MPNVLNADSARSLVARAGKKLPQGAVRDRFERLTFAQLLRDARNLRPADDYDVCLGPDWARTARDRGEDLVVCELNHSAIARVHNIARRLAAVCSLAEADDGKQPHLRRAISEARRLIAKIDHAGFDAIAAKAQRLARLLKEVASDADLEHLSEERAVAATCKRTWRLVTSAAELRTVGREFRNCLARPPHAEYNAQRLRCGSHQYWVLRDAEGVGLVVLMTDAPQATHFIEVRGPRNNGVRGHDADLRLLAVALGMNIDPPPPPAPPSLRERMRFEETRQYLLRIAAA